jgi:ariadne-1
MGDWTDHGANTGGYYKCNKYDTNPSGDDLTDAARAKRELDRYLHFYKRYHAHAEAQEFAKKQLKETEARMILLQESSENAKWTDVEFLKTANEQLVECRRVLKYTYVFAYYMTGKQAMQRERFEHHQEMLEKFTENLSELSEKPLAEMDRTDVVNQVSQNEVVS